MPIKPNGKVKQSEEREEERDDDCGLKGMAARAGFGEMAEFGKETGVEKEEEDREIPEDGKKIEAVAGAGIRDGLLVFLWREVVGGGGILRRGSRGWSGDILSGNGLQSDGMGARRGRSEDEHKHQEQKLANHEPVGGLEVHRESI